MAFEFQVSSQGLMRSASEGPVPCSQRQNQSQDQSAKWQAIHDACDAAGYEPVCYRRGRFVTCKKKGTNVFSGSCPPLAGTDGVCVEHKGTAWERCRYLAEGNNAAAPRNVACSDMCIQRQVKAPATAPPSKWQAIRNACHEAGYQPVCYLNGDWLTCKKKGNNGFGNSCPRLAGIDGKCVENKGTAW
eukprot:CAMPEP_0197660532 /NCGR_PEP_ID=MMETSP1338-20131121/50901_1 /TAXON_ID=43686 ORGANISM="Pelagodinium beii, Strain RCC1491" /NCGR_SAMPLE_ID=MMETSP1338 /ASSEMBLY_ACC=CAM_ASM_000754 /LENGTH=187 /DNA_ID=CAMNT_0043237901 /DNA_START=117 /DNA_END=677 /DNA_ORIENTATION=+